MNLLEKATKNIKDILITNYKIVNLTKVLVIFDENSTLSSLLKNASILALEELKQEFELVDFYLKDSDFIADYVFENSKKSDVILTIQSSSFRVSKYRWRNELCNRGLKVCEFGQLGKVKDDEIERFINSLTTDFDHYEKISNKIIPLINLSKEIKIISTNNSILKYSGKMDKCLKNTGALWEQTNWTTRFPIGEIICESLDLTTLNGKFLGYAYPSIKDQTTQFTKPFKCEIKEGLFISNDGPKEFKEIIELIKTENEEKEVFVRELGLGLNRNIKRFGCISEPMAYERVEGLHFSLGMKHGMYQKKLWPKYGKKFHQKFHIDIFVDVKEIYIDDELVFTYNQGYF